MNRDRLQQVLDEAIGREDSVRGLQVEATWGHICELLKEAPDDDLPAALNTIAEMYFEQFLNTSSIDPKFYGRIKAAMTSAIGELEGRRSR